ncbi:MAG: RidA family protein [Kiloniellaceae bacterium]
MSLKHLNAPDAAPAPPGARYSHAVMAGPFLYVTGQLPADPDDMAAPLPEGIEAQTRLVFKNLRRIVAHCGYALADTVFARVYLTDFKADYPGMNAVYGEFFADAATLPGRTTVGVTALARDARVEIDLVLYRAG